MSGKRIAVSYAWGPEKDKGSPCYKVVDHFCEVLSASDVEVIRDVDHVKWGDDLIKFMKNLGVDQPLYIFLSDSYLRSPNCTYELLRIWKYCDATSQELMQKIRVWIMPSSNDVSIHKNHTHNEYVKFWREKKQKTDEDFDEYHKDNPGEERKKEKDRISEIALYIDDILQYIFNHLNPSTYEDFLKWALKDKGIDLNTNEKNLKIESPEVAQKADLTEDHIPLEKDEIKKIIYHEAIIELEEILNSCPFEPEFLVKNGVNCVTETHAWKLNEKVKSFQIKNEINGWLESINKGLNEEKECNYAAELERFVSGLVLFSIDFDWFYEKACFEKGVRFEIPENSYESCHFKSDGFSVNSLLLVTQFLSGSILSLGRLFKIEEFENQLPSYSRSVGALDEDKKHQFKLHLINCITKNDKFDKNSESLVEKKMKHVRDTLMLKKKKGIPVHSFDSTYCDEIVRFLDEIKIEELYILFPTENGDLGDVVESPVLLFDTLFAIHKKLQNLKYK